MCRGAAESNKPRFEVADVVRRYGAAFLRSHAKLLTFVRMRVLRDLLMCRTEVLGGHVNRCTNDAHCEHEDQSYNSCRNRCCPKCGGTKQRKWTEQRLDEVLPTRYFHVVFTLPAELAQLALQNQTLIFNILMRAAAATLIEIAANPAHLGACIGMLAVLHTWGSDLLFHPHVHILIPGGGISLDGLRWIACKNNFFLPVRVLSALFRGKVLAMVKDAYVADKLTLCGDLQGLRDPAAFKCFLKPLYKKKWVVYAKRPPPGGPEQVIKYLARYVHRTAISNHRLLAIDNGTVTFACKNYRTGRDGTVTLQAGEFLRRFLNHVPPRGFRRIRHYGLFGGSNRRANLEKCRELIAASGLQLSDPAPGEPEHEQEHIEGSGDPADPFQRLCPKCGVGHMKRVATLLRQPPPDRVARLLEELDTT